MIIDAETFNDLKERVKAECNRRCYTGSLAEMYGDDAYYNPPYDGSSGQRIEKGFLNKLVGSGGPLKAINQEQLNRLNINETIIRSKTMDDLNQFLTEKESISLDSTNSGCQTSCTGLCFTDCGAECSEACGNECSEDTCTGGCGADCEGTCAYECDNVCEDSCENSCEADACTGSCSDEVNSPS